MQKVYYGKRPRAYESCALTDWATPPLNYRCFIIDFIFKNDDAVKVNCYDWDKNMEYKDALVLNIDAFEYRNFLSNEAYK